MHDIKWIRENPETFDAGLKRRGLEPQAAALLALDDKRRAAIAKAQTAQERRNAASKDVGAAMKAGDGAKAAILKQEVADLKTALTTYEDEERRAIATLDAALAQIPTSRCRTFPTARTRMTTRSFAPSAASRNSASQRKSISRSGKTLA